MHIILSKISNLLPSDKIFLPSQTGLPLEVRREEFAVFIYNNYVYSQNPITPELLKRLADHGLRGFKDSSFYLVNFFQFQETVYDYPDFNAIVDTEAIFIAAFDAVAIRTVFGMANTFSEIMVKIYKQ